MVTFLFKFSWPPEESQAIISGNLWLSLILLRQRRFEIRVFIRIGSYAKKTRARGRNVVAQERLLERKAKEAPCVKQRLLGEEADE